MLTIRLIIVVCSLLPSQWVMGEDDPNFYLLQYQSGPAWSADLGYHEQPGIERHLAYLNQLQEANLLMMSGVTQSGNGVIVLLRAESPSQAEQIMVSDPAVQAGILTGTATGWRVYQSAMRHVGPGPTDTTKAQPYRLERLDPSSPISLKQPAQQ